MRSRRPLPPLTARLLSVVAAAAVTVGVLLGTSAPARMLQAQGTSGAVAAARTSGEFGIRVGAATGLHPGGGVTVPVRYNNPFPHALVVRSQDIQVTSPSPLCPATTIDLTRARTVLGKSLVVPAREARTIEIVLVMRAGAPDGCQGVRLTTTIKAQGRKK